MPTKTQSTVQIPEKKAGIFYNYTTSTMISSCESTSKLSTYKKNESVHKVGSSTAQGNKNQSLKSRPRMISYLQILESTKKIPSILPISIEKISRSNSCMHVTTHHEP